MMDKIKLLTFTDPMMGLSYEMEPVMRRLETHFAGHIEFRTAMAVLVPDVMRLVDPADLQQGRAYALHAYNKRLAQIYRDEESIGGLPIHMDDFALFSESETNSRPLCLAYKAVEAIAPKKAEAFLYRLLFATIAETRRTTRMDELLRVAGKCGIDGAAFERAYTDGTAEQALAADLALVERLGIRTLPAYLTTYGERAMLLQTFSYDDFHRAIERLSDGAIYEMPLPQTLEAITGLLKQHPLISSTELCAAFNFSSDAALHSFLVFLLRSLSTICSSNCSKCPCFSI